VHVLLSGIVGSTAYGLAHAGSDVDRLGIFAVPTVELHGLGRPKESVVTTNPDSTMHEAAKAVRLILGCNPTASEILWLPGELYETRTALGDELIGIRDSLVSAKAVRGAFLGYADQQLRKIKTRGPDSRLRSAKHARHLARLCLQGAELHQQGRLTIELEHPERVRELGERIAENPEVGDRVLADAEAVFDRPGVLPAAPDEAAAEAWLRRVRAAYWTEAAA
jgi:predicted nucleotidyltransferase